MKSKLVLARAALLFSLAAGADESSQAGGSTPEAASAASAEAKPTRHDCLRETGSRIKRKGDDCLNVPGRSYGQDEISETGRTNLGDALRQIDPSIH